MMRRRAMLCVAVAVAIAGCSKDEGTPMTPTPAALTAIDVYVVDCSFEIVH